MQITAKIRCSTRETQGDQDKVTFTANYTDENGARVNTEWARATPGFSLTMWVLPEVPFEAGKAYTLTFDDGEG